MLQDAGARYRRRPSPGARPIHRAAMTLKMSRCAKRSTFPAQRRTRAITRSARADVGHGFAVRATIIEQIPGRAFGSNLRRPSTFVVAVIPLDQICIDRGDSAEAGEFARSPCALKRTGEYVAKAHGAKTSAQRSGVILTARCQGDVRAAGVLMRDRPGSLAVANQAYVRQNVRIHGVHRSTE